MILKKILSEISERILTYLHSFNTKSTDYSPEYIFNMDETPYFSDLLGRKTVNYLGKKSIDVVTSGHDNFRFTVVVTISAAGKLLPFYVIFRAGFGDIFILKIQAYITRKLKRLCPLFFCFSN